MARRDGTSGRLVREPRALGVDAMGRRCSRCAREPELELVFSNTTEVGIVLDETDALAAPGRRRARSPASSAAFLLLERARVDYDTAVRRSSSRELIEDNGDRLREIVVTLAQRWKLGPSSSSWLECRSVLQHARRPHRARCAERADASELRQLLGYEDGMITICRAVRLFAIEGDAALRERLRFAEPTKAIIVAGHHALPRTEGPIAERRAHEFRRAWRCSLAAGPCARR